MSKEIIEISPVEKSKLKDEKQADISLAREKEWSYKKLRNATLRMVQKPRVAIYEQEHAP